MTSAEKSRDWSNILFLTLSPILALGGVAWYGSRWGVHPAEVGLFFLFYLFTGLSITGGYHRYYAHRSYDARRPLEVFYLLFGAAALQNSALRWSRDHRIHHQKTDKDEDPYSILKGVFHAHMGWIFYKNPERDDDFSRVPDLAKNPLVAFQERHYLPLAIGMGFVLPTLLGWSIGRPLGGFLWGGLLRAVFVQHMTFCINSVAHLFGSRPYTLANSARDSWWLSLLTYGEGYHNYHHRFPADYRNGIRWYHWDITKWWINAMAAIGQVSGKRWVREDVILRARIETDIERAKLALVHAPETFAVRFEARLEAARVQLESAAAQWERSRIRFVEAKRSALLRYSDAAVLWKWKVRECDLQYRLAHARWCLLLAAASRFSPHGPIV